VKEPTPDLTNVTSILQRQRRLTQWDIKPPNYENITSEQAKMSGMFPLPGAPRQQPMDLSRLQAMVNQPGSQASATALKPSNARQSKRLFVYNIPPGNTADSMVEFFNLHLNGLNVIKSQDPCLSALMSQNKKVALLEFKFPEEATVALALDGITMDDEDNMEAANGNANGHGRGLHVTRPKDYIAPTPDPDAERVEGQMTDKVPDSPNKIMVTNIPAHASDEAIIELLSAFGPLKAFILVKDADTEQSRGIAFCEYEDSEQTTKVVQNLNGMDLGGLLLVVKHASIGLQQAAGLEMGVNAMSMIAGTTSTDLQKSRVIQLLNMVTADELVDNDEYAGKCIFTLP
jgi:splicing factor U2AF 65 kDa subunit